MDKQQNYRVIKDPIYGYGRLEPVPDVREITKFYESRYYDPIRKGERAPDVRRLMAGGTEAEREGLGSCLVFGRLRKR